MNIRESASLDRYITGSYGEDQFRKPARDPRWPKWSEIWLQFASKAVLQKALAQAQNNCAYLGDHNNHARYWKWERRRAAVAAELESRN